MIPPAHKPGFAAVSIEKVVGPAAYGAVTVYDTIGNRLYPPPSVLEVDHETDNVLIVDMLIAFAATESVAADKEVVVVVNDKAGESTVRLVVADSVKVGVDKVIAVAVKDKDAAESVICPADNVICAP